MMKKLMLTAAFAGVVMFLAAGCCGFGKDGDSCKKCGKKECACVEKGSCPMKANADKASCPMKADGEKTVVAPAK